MADEPTLPVTGDPTPAATPDPQVDTTGSQIKKLGGGEDGLKADLAAERKQRQALAAQIKELTPLAEKAKELEEASKTETEKLAEKLRSAEADGTTTKTSLLRLEVALDKAPTGMAPGKIRSLAGRLKGSTREELEADAKELFADFGAASTAIEEPAGGQPAIPKPDPAQGSRGGVPTARPTSMTAAIGAALKPKT